MRIIPALAALLAGIFRRKPNPTVIETPFRDAPAARPRSTFWEGRTKIAPGMLRRAARQKNRRAAPPIDRSKWTRETTTVALTHREPDGTLSTFETPVWMVDRAPWFKPRQPQPSRCTCPPVHTGLVASGCMVHFGDGYGHCIPHMVDTETLLAAVTVVDGVGLCRLCLRAHNRRAA